MLVSSEPTGGTATVPASTGISFAIPPAAVPPAVAPTLADGAAPMALTWNLETNGAPTITQTATASATSATTTNGFASGTLQTYDVQPDGTIEGTFSSGQTLALGQVAVASFANSQGLVSYRQQQLQPSAASGAAVVGAAGTADGEPLLAAPWKSQT